jgi:Zn-dependent protease with chaperone function
MKPRRNKSGTTPIVLAGLAALLLAVVGAVTLALPESPSSAAGTQGDSGTDSDAGTAAATNTRDPGDPLRIGRREHDAGRSTILQRIGIRPPAPTDRTLNLTRARDVDRRSDYHLDPRARECQRPLMASTMAQSALFSGYEIVRGNTPPMPWADEQALGARLHQILIESSNSPFYGKLSNDTARITYLQRLVDLIASYRENEQIEFRVHLIDDPRINAFATIGGYVYVLTGLLDQSVLNEAQLMAVLSHELGHIDRRHTAYLGDILANEGLGAANEPDFGVAAIILGRIATMVYSRELEDECDRYAYDRLTRIGYSPFQMEAWFWQMHALEVAQTAGQGPRNPLEAELQNLLSTHSSSDARACNLRRMIVESPPPEVTYRGTMNLATNTPAEDRIY